MHPHLSISAFRRTDATGGSRGEAMAERSLRTCPLDSCLEALGLTATVADLVSLNQQMKHLIELRNNDLAQVTPQAMSQARAASDEAYQLVVTIINALAVTDWADGSSHYDQAIARINQDQDYYVKNVFAQGKGGSASGNGDSGSGSGSGSDSGDNGGSGSGSGDSGSGSGDNGDEPIPGGDNGDEPIPGGDNGDEPIPGGGSDPVPGVDDEPIPGGGS